jgi:hypothetical protein
VTSDLDGDNKGKKTTTTSLNFDIEAVKLDHARKAWPPREEEEEADDSLNEVRCNMVYCAIMWYEVV